MTRIRVAPRRSKYNAVPTVVDGVRFASKKEAARFMELKLLERTGEIEGLELQPKFPLKTLLTTGTLRGAGQALVGDYPVIGHYVADFKYYDLRKGEWVIEDVKSPATRTPIYIWKAKHVRAQYGITVTEV